MFLRLTNIRRFLKDKSKVNTKEKVKAKGESRRQKTKGARQK